MFHDHDADLILRPVGEEGGPHGLDSYLRARVSLGFLGRMLPGHQLPGRAPRAQ